jgi:predicted phosphoadenosine phosphosulfate sulfurtransferase
MQARVPGASTAARYAKTTLYGFGMKPTKMPGKTWKETLVSYMNRHTGNSRKIVAERLEREITRHYKLTKDPIVTQSPHPMTGVSWQWLASLASRGDLKNRRQPRIFRYHEKDNPETIKAWDNYRKEQSTWAKTDD